MRIIVMDGMGGGRWDSQGVALTTDSDAGQSKRECDCDHGVGSLLALVIGREA